MFKSRNTPFVRKFVKDDAGHVAVIFALAVIPLLVVTTAALDHHESTRYQTHVKAALDGAVLAAASNQVVTESERAELAKQFFWDNISDYPERVNLDIVESGSDRVELAATVTLPTTLLALTGRKSFSVKSESAATVTRGGVVCMMTLDNDQERSFEVTGGAVFEADTCAVQVNPTHAKAAVIDHGGRARASDFCVAGASTGPFEPHVNSECGVMDDPYKNLRAPDTGECVDDAELLKHLSSWQAESIGVELKPGTYCGGLSLVAKRIKFAPGVYTIKDGPLFFDYGTVAEAKGVTFVMQGDDARLDVHEGSSVNIRAPKEGPTAGLAFFQDIHSNAKNFPKLPSNNSIIRSGGNVKIVGTVYLPHQQISFRGGSLSEAQAPATSFIGYRIHIGDGARIGVAVDHEVAGLPPIEPRHDESVRLEK